MTKIEDDMGRTSRLSRHEQPPSPRRWYTINSAPRDGSRIELYIPYDRSNFTEDQCTDQGYWDPVPIEYPDDPNSPRGCFRFDGDDGVFDIQPTAWRPLPRT